MPQKIILDTDIGDDIDDALALGLICASPELELVGVTTVFANVVARSRQARTVLCAAGDRFKNIPVAAGCGACMASRPMNNANDYLADKLPNQDASCLPSDQLPPLHSKHAVQFLIDTIMASNGDIVPICIGAMTNMAAALVLERRLVKKIPRIVAMAAEFREPFAEWNIRCDPEAAHIIFSSGIPMLVTPWTIGKQVSFTPEEIDRLASSPRPLAKNLSAAIRLWRGVNSAGHMPSLYDPMAVATMIKPDLCTWRTGTVQVELAGQHTYGFTTFQPSENGPHRVAWDAQREASINFYLSRVMPL
jgi:inosine-uridine nucleoside N-ribohydrolase